jgi:hypothetical protein
MKLQTIYIISYLPDDITLRNKRKEFHKKQLEWCNDNNLEVIVIAMNYTPEDYIDGIRYIYKGEKMPPGYARNVALKDFYNSNRDFAVFADDDSILSSPGYGYSDTFFQKFNKWDTKKQQKLYYVQPVIPNWMPYKKTINTHTDFAFDGCIKAKSSFFILKNFKKHHQVEFYFSEEFKYVNNILIPSEEFDFVIQLNEAGFTTLTMKNIVLYEYAAKDSDSTYVNSRQERLRGIELSSKLLLKLHPDCLFIKTYKYVCCSIFTDKTTKEVSYKLRLKNSLPNKSHDIWRASFHNKDIDVKTYTLPRSLLFSDIKKGVISNELNFDQIVNELIQTSNKTDIIEYKSKNRIFYNQKNYFSEKNKTKKIFNKFFENS